MRRECFLGLMRHHLVFREILSGFGGLGLGLGVFVWGFVCFVVLGRGWGGFFGWCFLGFFTFLINQASYNTAFFFSVFFFFCLFLGFFWFLHDSSTEPDNPATSQATRD